MEGFALYHAKHGYCVAIDFPPFDLDGEVGQVLQPEEIFLEPFDKNYTYITVAAQCMAIFQVDADNPLLWHSPVSAHYIAHLLGKASFKVMERAPGVGARPGSSPHLGQGPKIVWRTRGKPVAAVENLAP